MIDKLVESMKLVDFSDMKLPMVVVYDHPSDYPDAYVARVWDIKENLPFPTNVLMKKDKLQEIRDNIRSARSMICISATVKDDPVIVEIWI